MGWNKNLIDYRKVAKVKHPSGYSFASKLERSVFDLLCLMEKAGEIQNIKCQDHVYLTEARIIMIPDFKVFDLTLEQNIWIEAKGYESDIWRIKRRLWKVYGPGRLRVYKAKGKALFMSEELYPRAPIIK